MSRYDAAVIGGGPEGLVAAILIARAGLSVALLERGAELGGRATTDEFHPGFRASRYADELPAMSARLYRVLDLARHDGILVPAPSSVCISDEGATVLHTSDSRVAWASPPAARDGLMRLRGELARLGGNIDDAASNVGPRPRGLAFPLLGRQTAGRQWPGEDWGQHALDEFLQTRLPDARLRLHLAADAVSGRAVSPFLTGSALHLLAPGSGRSGTVAGGLGRFGASLETLARKAGVSIRCEAKVAAIGLKRGRANALMLDRGEDIEARAILSTLDFKHTFLELLDTEGNGGTPLPQAARFRIAGQMARVLIALDAPPDLAFAHDDPDAAHGPIHVAGSLQALNRTHDLWHAGTLDVAAPVTLRVPSLADPRLAPVGKATMTATVSGVPARLFDGLWTDEKRAVVRDIALAAADRASPGLSSRVLAACTVLPSDIEAELGATAGDLDGGEIAPDQVFPFPCLGRDGAVWDGGRTPIRGLYVAGSCVAPSPFLLGAAGERAARAVVADLSGRRLA